MDGASEQEQPLRLLSENPIEEIWTQLSLWESENLARKLIADRAGKARVTISDQLLSRKAQALSYCVRTARDNIRNPFGGLTVGNVCNYYGCMWLAAAMLAADPSNEVDLERLEQHTKRGHGLGNFSDASGTFPDNEYLYVRESGFFREFLRARGVEKATLATISVAGGMMPATAGIPEDIRARLVPLDALFARVPEIRSIYEYVTGRPPLSFGVAHASRNMQENFDDTKEAGVLHFSRSVRTRDYTWIVIHGSSLYSDQHIMAHGPPIRDLEWSTYALATGWHAKFYHAPEGFWHDHLTLHRSAMTGPSWIKPLFANISDVFATHLMLLYGLSILSRYRPAVWREVLEGSSDQYRAMIAGYYNVFQRVLPELALKDILARDLIVAMPGGFNAPI